MYNAKTLGVRSVLSIAITQCTLLRPIFGCSHAVATRCRTTESRSTANNHLVLVDSFDLFNLHVSSECVQCAGSLRSILHVMFPYKFSPRGSSAKR
ncbi:unnamed protein product [Leptidea sinapis]|uniref:Uncharacterized protein n=1 Tax=Leptidea sinapis TaxID=189913 RepID=A0A5E4QHX2_9NEOP|nr:unnamed protein product [Leptidea sinapis]